MSEQKPIAPDGRIDKSEEEWARELTPEQFQVTRRAGTERAFTGAYFASKDPGLYHCVCCDAPLFDAAHKYESGTGWPSFFQPISDNVTAARSDRSMFMVRTEVICATCDAHLGHIFEDGPKPTGLRYCLNSVALQLRPPAVEDDQDD